MTRSPEEDEILFRMREIFEDRAADSRVLLARVEKLIGELKDLIERKR